MQTIDFKASGEGTSGMFKVDNICLTNDQVAKVAPVQKGGSNCNTETLESYYSKSKIDSLVVMLHCGMVSPQTCNC